METLLPLIPSDFYDLHTPKPTEKNKARTLLEKHLTDYVGKNSFDYFIHKDLGGFLSRELDFYIKNEVLYIDDLEHGSEQRFFKQLAVVKTLKQIGNHIIGFLASLENFQKRLWLKKKFVVESHYCITLDRIPGEFYAEIAANEAQREEWIRLFAIDEIKSGAGNLFGSRKSYSEPLSVEFLQENPFLVLDTAFFSEDFKCRLVSCIDDIDAQTDGVLISSENFQAINLLQEKYCEQIKCIYIDPPYNSPSSEIAYKNSFKHSSWLSLMDNRLSLGKNLLKYEGSQVVAIDKYEHGGLFMLMENLYEGYDVTSVSIEHNKKGTQGDHFSYNGEYAIFAIPGEKKKLNSLQRDKKDWEYSAFRNWGGESERSDAANCFFPIYVLNSEIIGYGSVCPDDFHPDVNQNIKTDFDYYDFNGKLKHFSIGDEKVIAIYPIDVSNIERKWRYAFQTMPEIISYLKVNGSKDNKQIEIPKYDDQFKTIWYDSKYNAGDYGTKILTNMGISKSLFQFPKSIYTTKDCIFAVSEKEDTILDFFAGSGTTGHAVICLNREDEGQRKYILVEMGEYFDTVTKPRIQKVIYSKDWKAGKPVSRDGSSHCFKYIRLESYEDTLNNLVVEQSTLQTDALETSDPMRNSFLLGYLLDTEARESLFNTDWFADPFNFSLKITRRNETKLQTIDLIDTFNYLIGLNVDSIAYPKDGLCTVTGTTRTGERTFILWRDTAKIPGDKLNTIVEKLAINPRDNEFDRIYCNGNNNLENIRKEDQTWKVILTEQEFAKRMFEK